MPKNKDNFSSKTYGNFTIVSGTNGHNDQWEFFDDCPICQAMKKAEQEGRSLSEKELKDVFQEANDKNKLTERVEERLKRKQKIK